MPKQCGPLEVELVGKVKACRVCKWFWKGTRPYGPYPGFDFADNSQLPAEVIRNWPQHTEQQHDAPREWLAGKTVGLRDVEPGILHGCRKAPIMTIGINPNLTAFSASAGSAPWVYPAFESAARYAYYYRHFTLYQENLAPEFLHDHLDPHDRLTARADGHVAEVSREFSHNYVQLLVRYADDDRDTSYEIVWKPESRWVLLRNPGKPEDAAAQFRRGDVLAARLNMPTAEMPAKIYSVPVGYYQRMVPILERFKSLTKLDGAHLTVGEDVSQHDMVACASPGWQLNYDMPLDIVAAHCVSERGWLVYQFVQSQPAVTIVVGAVALKMFQSVFGPFTSLKTENKDLYQIIQDTCLRPSYVQISLGAVQFKTRVIVAPHFSYDDGFFSGSRLSTTAWAAFSSDFRADAELLNVERCVTRPDRTGAEPAVLVQIKPEVEKELSPRARAALDGYFVDPAEMIARALADEYEHAGTMAFDTTTGHLTRTAGPCQFCVNDRWTFPEKCPYGKPGSPGNTTQELVEAALAILAAAKARSAQPLLAESGDAVVCGENEV